MIASSAALVRLADEFSFTENSIDVWSLDASVSQIAMILIETGLLVMKMSNILFNRVG